MLLVSQLKGPHARHETTHPAVSDISPSLLQTTVETLAFPRHYIKNREANKSARDWISEILRNLGFLVHFQGSYDNIIAKHPDAPRQPLILIGAHYDTVPTTPGADDNNSAIAVCLETARVLASHTNIPLIIAIFNREEDGLLGSFEFVKYLGASIHTMISEAHIFEMVGYFSNSPYSQAKPANLPILLPKTGNFIGVLSNTESNKIVRHLFHAAKYAGISIPMVSLKIFFGVEKLFRDLLRSDHTPFWLAKVPALMWTDTSNFRNPHYHAPTDTPDTLNYEALADVTRIIVNYICLRSKKFK